jgi:1,4-alpha-glucan branching enzyme
MVIHDTDKGQVVFVYTPVAPVKKVCVGGDFNGWDPSARRMSRFPKDGTYRARLSLAPGRYEYKFVVDGEWVVDATASDVQANPLRHAEQRAHRRGGVLRLQRVHLQQVACRASGDPLRPRFRAGVAGPRCGRRQHRR